MGCVRSASCNLCADQLCNICSGFGQGSCTTCTENAQGAVCSCNADSILIKSLWKCLKCDNNYCEECAMREETYFNCNKCSKGYLFQGVCLDENPYGANRCSELPCLVINAEFETDFKGVYDVFRTCSGSDTFHFWNSPEACDPIPAKDRGLYFNGNQFLASDLIYFSHSFSIVSWINSYGEGVIFQKNDRIMVGSDFSAQITMFSPAGGVKEESIIQSIISGWCQFELALSFLNGIQTITIFLNGIQARKLSESEYLYRDVSSYLVIGKGGSNFYFKGFIYDFNLFIGTINDPSLYNGKSICAVGSERPCLSPCAFFEFYDDGCIACNDKCSNGCVRPKSCNLCSDILCIKCPSFSDGHCNECVANAQGSVCTCNIDSILIKNEIDWACEKCDNGYCKACDKREATYFDCKECENGYLINRVCLDQVPYGFEENKCLDSACLVINAEFEAEFSGIYDVFKTCGSSSSFNYW
ncbi:unnamed protein product [Blepharisma stoltei]|uniref:TNFR-Cys domain-containing protein n=1 Tax=Blepharisma stoltei TaxID=1481888 RepID=A0AAU9JIE3_9CILI|nr:unnamed protein product [Blepharisma stoltei]